MEMSIYHENNLLLKVMNIDRGRMSLLLRERYNKTDVRDP